MNTATVLAATATNAAVPALVARPRVLPLVAAVLCTLSMLAGIDGLTLPGDHAAPAQMSSTNAAPRA
jgi:hypothetical protein